MGILNLLLNWKNTCLRNHVSHYKGLTIGVDIFCWLHGI